MSGYKIGMAEEAVIADLTAKLVECKAQKEAALRIADQHSDVVNNMILQLTEREKDRDAWENACAHWEKEAIESQAREAKLREVLNKFVDTYGKDDVRAWMRVLNSALHAIALPHNDTALKEYRKKVLLEAATKLEDNPGRFYFDGVDELRKMAEE